MLSDINTDSADKNVLYEMFKTNGKTDLLDRFCINFALLDLGDAYGNLCNKLKELFDDQTNGTKYFNNLVNILELLNWTQNVFEVLEYNYFQSLWNKFKSEDKIGEFIKLVKNFDGSDSEYMFVVKDANGKEFKTPGLQITTAQVLFDNNEVIIASDINNTCKTGSTIKNQFTELSLDPYDKSIYHNLDKNQRDKWTINEKLNRDVFGNDSHANEFLLALKKIKDYYEYKSAIKKTYDLSLLDLNNLITKVKSYYIYNFARLLSKPENGKVLFYNVPIRGKGNGDFHYIDSEEFELFSIFDKNFMFKLGRYHLGENDFRNSKISFFDKYGANFLFDQVSYNSNNQQKEGYEAESSLLTNLGKNITETGLKWFLDENEYDIIGKDDVIKVTNKQKKQPDEDMNIINTNNNLLLEGKKLSDQTVFNQISRLDNDIDQEIGSYTDKLITDVINLFRIYFEQSQIMDDMEIKTDNSDLDNKGKLNNKIEDKVTAFIDNFCGAYDNGVTLCLNDAKMSDACNFKYLVKKVIAPLIISYFQGLDDGQKQDLIKGQRSIVGTIGELYQDKLFNRDKVRDKLVKEIYYDENGWSNPQKYDSQKQKFVENDFKFNFTEANLKAKKTATLLNKSFDKFKEKVAEIYKNGLPDSEGDFEKNFDKVDCTEFINFLKDQMKIDVDKEFLKKALSAMFYTWVESVHGQDDNGDSKKVAERLQEMRLSFFGDYAGTKFIHEVKLYTSCMIDKGEKPLPDAFYWYNSDNMKIGGKDSVAYRFTVVNYFQAFFHAIPALQRKKFKNLHWWSHRKFNRNIENTRRILQTGTRIERNQIFGRIRQIRDQKYKNKDNIWGLPLAFLDILFDGVSIDLSLQEKIEICTLARNYVDHELDNETKQHVTKSNFMEIDKKDNCYLKSEGQVVLPLANLFAPGATDEFINKIIFDDIWNNSFCYALCKFLAFVWYCCDRNNLPIKLLAKALFILCFTFLSPIIGIMFLIAYIVYTKDLKNELNNRIADDDTLNKLRQAENKGRKEYNRLQNFRLNMQKQKPPNIIKAGKQKINLDTADLNSEFKTINDLKTNYEDKINNNNISEINTNINQINQFN